MSRHAVVMITYNNLHLTKQALESVAVQDIGELEIWVMNNGSTDGTKEWLEDFKTFVADSHQVHLIHLQENTSPCILSNQIMDHVFKSGHDKLLGVPNDVVLPENFYRLANESPRGIVCGSMTGEKEFPRFKTATAMNECTPMAVGLIRRWCFDALLARDGYFFDEQFQHYASDCDFALRLASCGIRGVQLDVQYWHYGSATLRLAPPDKKREMDRQADADRAYFERKWGFKCTDLEYGACAADINFRGKSLVQAAGLAR